MRIAYVCADRGVPVFGKKGCSIHVQEVLRAMLKRGWTVDLYASRPGGEPADDLRDASVHRLPQFVPGESQGDAARDLVFDANRCLHATLQENGPYDLIYERYSLWSFAAQEYAADNEIPSVLEVNAPLIEEQSRYRTLTEPQLAEELTTRAFASSRSLVAVSEEVADYLRKRPETSRRVHVVSNGVSAERFCRTEDRVTRRSDFGSTCHFRADHPFTIAFVGSLKPWHGVETLIDAFARVSRTYPDVRLRIVGDGPERQSLQNRVHRTMPSRVDMVEFCGAVDHDRVPGILAHVDVAVAPYPDLDGFYFSPLKIYEYMAAGCAVVASRVGAPARIITSGKNGLLCVPEDCADLADKLRTLYSNPDLCRELGDAARSMILRQHTWDHVLQAILATVDAAGEPMLAEVLR
ncbi:MAG: glycosyltransferase family 4 protein [Planctomycetaceae bacterium]